MEKQKYDDSCHDYEYERTGGRKSVSEQNLTAARRASFTPIQIQDCGKARFLTALDAYMLSLKQAALRGDENARDELDKYQEYSQKIFEAQKRRSHSPVFPLMEKQRRLKEFAEKYMIIFAARLIGEIYDRYTKKFGTRSFVSNLIPHYIDATRIAALARRLKRRRKKSNSQYKVGYKKPPESTRFTSAHNPRTIAKTKNFFEKLDDKMSEKVTVTSAKGKKLCKSAREVTYEQQFRDAIKGKRRARAQVRKVIIRLFERGMLCPPERPRRLRRKAGQIVPRQRTQAKVVEVMTVPLLKRDIVERFERHYGHLPEFATEYERSLPKLDEVEGWAELQAEIAKRRSGDQTVRSDDLGAQEQSATPSAPYPTRPRARSTPPRAAHSKTAAET